LANRRALDVSTVRADPNGKRHHVVETLDVIYMGTSVLFEAQVGDTFTAETAEDRLAQTWQRSGLAKQITLDRDVRWVGSPHGSDFPSALLRFAACLGIQMQVCDPHHPHQNGFVERSHRTSQEACLALDRPPTLERARAVTESFQQHSNVQRPDQALSCGNQAPRPAFPPLPTLPALPHTIDPDGWLEALDGLHLERKVDAHGMVSVDLKRYDVSSHLVGHHVVLHLDAANRCLHVLHEHQVIKSLPKLMLVGQRLSFEQFLTHMLHQARAQARLRSLQERKYRTAAFAAPSSTMSWHTSGYDVGIPYTSLQMSGNCARRLWFFAHQALLPGEYGCLRAVEHVQFAEDIAHVPFDGFFADHQFVGDSRVREAIGDQAQDFEFAVTQFYKEIWRVSFGSTYLLDNARGYARMQHRFACGSFTHRLGQFIRADIFQDVGEGAGAQRWKDVFVLVIGGEHDDLSMGTGLFYLSRGFDASYAGHYKVYKQDVGNEFGGHAYSGFAGVCFSDYGEVGLYVEECAHSLSNQCVVVRDDDGDLFCHVLCPS
jgi:hypothetical protein